MNIKVGFPLQEARQLFSQLTPENYTSAYDCALRSLASLQHLASLQIDDVPAFLAHYTAARVMINKVLRKTPDSTIRYLFDPARQGQVHQGVQVFVLDRAGERVLVPTRGPYKRLFPGKQTVSANAHLEPGQCPRTAAAEAIREALGLLVDRARLTQIGAQDAFDGHLVSYDLLAFTQKKANRLREACAELRDRSTSPNGVLLDYSAAKRSLCVFSVDERVPPNQVLELAQRLGRRTGIPIVYPVHIVSKNTLFVCRLDQVEQNQIEKGIKRASTARQEAQVQLGQPPLTPDELEECVRAIDADTLRFVDGGALLQSFADQPLHYALDLMRPYLRSAALWREVGLDRAPVRSERVAIRPYRTMIGLDHPSAHSAAIVGGKVQGLYELYKLCRAPGTGPRFSVPQTRVLTALAYQRVILQDPDIRANIVQLDNLSRRVRTHPTAETRRLASTLAAEIRGQIVQAHIPGDLQTLIRRAFRGLGGCIALRSSATLEDSRECSAAGLADSYLNVIEKEQAIVCVKKVWASLFNEGFVALRNRLALAHLDARMAVVLQAMVQDVAAAGVLFTIHPSGRPVYTIEAKLGLGEGVVQGTSTVDRWCTSPHSEKPLEKWIAAERSSASPDQRDGAQTAYLCDTAPCLTDEQAQQVTRIAHAIHCHWRTQGLAEHVDVEFALGKEGTVSIVQARPKTIRALRQTTVTMNVVDRRQIPADVAKVTWDGRALVAQPGAVTAVLQVDVPPQAAQAGTILVVEHTNNEANGQFAQLAGVITQGGGSTSHAANNAQELGIPCLVGALGAIARLKPYDGRVVTFDAEARTVYLGPVPIHTVRRNVSVWTPLEKLPPWERHEIDKSWHERKQERPGVFIEDLEGRWRRRSHTIRPFQLDLYYQAWDRLTAFLNARFADRCPPGHRLGVQERAIKKFNHRLPGIELLHRITAHDSAQHGNVYRFIAGIPGLDVQDLWALYDERQQAFERFGDFMQGFDRINAGTVEALVKELINVFQWMHIAYWLGACVDKLFAFEQKRYIDPRLHRIFQDAALLDKPLSCRTSLSRLKDKETWSITERVRSTPALSALFMSGASTDVERELKDHSSEILERIAAWSTEYKATSEHIQRLSDTPEYLDMIQDRLARAATPGIELVALWFRAFKEELPPVRAQSPAEAVAEIRAQDEDLYWLLCGYARSVLAGGKDTDQLTPQEIARGLPLVLQNVEQYARQRTKREQEIRRWLEYFPRLKSVLALSKLETMLREDAHHHIVGHQRKIARLMLEMAQARPDLFSDPDAVFDLSTTEMIALLTNDECDCIRLTPERWRLFEQAEACLYTAWDTDPAQAVDEFAARTEQMIGLLDIQSAQARDPGLKQYYDCERTRLQQRVTSLRKRAQGALGKPTQTSRQRSGSLASL